MDGTMTQPVNMVQLLTVRQISPQVKQGGWSEQELASSHSFVFFVFASFK